MLTKTRAVAKKLGRRLKALRQENGISQEELADAIGFGRSYYWRLEQGQINPTLDSLVRLAEQFKVSIRDLFD